MTKQEKLDKLDEAVLDAMLRCFESGETNLLTEYSNAIAYLKANQKIEDKVSKETDPIEARKKKLKEAEERRNNEV